MAKKKKDTKCRLLPYTKKNCLSLQDAKQKAGWEITAFNLPEAWKKSQGEGAIIAVLDTGADLDHTDLNDNLLPGINFVEPGKDPWDNNGHGCMKSDTLIHTNYCGIEQMETLYNRVSIPAVFDGKAWIKDIRNFGIKTYSLNPITGTTELSEIEFLHKIKIKDDIINITLEGNICLSLTKWHPVYVSYTTLGGRKKITKKRADT